MNISKNQNLGFSLLEMMVVVAILAIIAGIAIPSYLRYVENSRLTQARAVLTQVQQDIQRVKLVQGSLGANSAAVVATVQGILVNGKSQGMINENGLNRFYGFAVVAGANTGQYFFNVTPINASKNGLYMDQSGNAFKCPNASSVTTRTGCEKM